MFYQTFVDGLPEALISARASSPQDAMYEFFSRRFCSDAQIKLDTPFTWLDLAAGTGIFSRLLARRFSKSSGTAADLHARPSLLSDCRNVDWCQLDFNSSTPFVNLPLADAVFAIGVLEHVRSPYDLVTSALGLLRPGGTLYLACPDTGSVAAHVMGRRWPYWLPGEHLNIPTVRGANALAHRSSAALGIPASIRVSPIAMPYTVRYVAAYVHAERMVQWVDPNLALSLPVGALDISISI
jgi:trans-aconitate methyltransferase